MDLPEPTALAAFHARLVQPLAIGVFVIYLLHVILVCWVVRRTLAPQRRNSFAVAVGGAFLVFVGGVAVAYRWSLPAISIADYRQAMRVMLLLFPSWHGYLSWALRLCLGFGLLCEFPVLNAVLGCFRLFSSAGLSAHRPKGYVILLILAAILAPTADPLTFLIFAIPAVIFYEASIGIIRLADRLRGSTPLAHN